MANKLELTWYGKDKPIVVEPRLLIENSALSNCANDPDTENMLIHGDNLLALKALEKKYTGQVKCIYIVPPYNTGAAFEYYEDNLEHSIWLNLMRARLQILHNLLASEGTIWIQIDDEEQAYLKVLCDEVFGRNNFVNMLSVNMKNIAGASGGGEDKRLKKNCEFILIYAKDYDLLPLFESAFDYTEMYEYVIQYKKENENTKECILQYLDTCNNNKIQNYAFLRTLLLPIYENLMKAIVNYFTLVKRNFGQFFKDMGLDPKNVDLMCALHLDRENHYHIHFAFWEKEPKFKYRKKQTEYRHKGKIEQTVIDNMRVRLALYISDMAKDVYLMRDEAIRRLRKMTALDKFIYSAENIKKEFISLCKDLPAGIPLEYGRKEIEPFRDRIDKIATMLFLRDREALKADERVYDKIAAVKEQIKEICEGTSESEKYHFGIKLETITIADKLEEDYRRRVGNIVLYAAKFIKPEYYERNPKRKYKVNDNKLKRRIAISERNVGKRFDRFILTFGKDCQILERDFTNRLQEIEEEIEEKKREEEEQNEREEINRSKYYWSK